MQVLANPTADIQEGPKVGRAELKARGVRPYDEKVQPGSLASTSLPSVVAPPTASTISWHPTPSQLERLSIGQTYFSAPSDEGIVDELS